MAIPIAFAGIPPVLPEYDEPYKLQIYSPKFVEMGIMVSIQQLVFRMRERLSQEVRDLVTRTSVCWTPNDIACRKEDIIINKIKYKPLNVSYRMLDMMEA